MPFRSLPDVGVPMSLSMINAEFGGEPPVAISEFYGVDDGIPVSGMISLSDFYGSGKTSFDWCSEDVSNRIGDSLLPDYQKRPVVSTHGSSIMLTYATDAERGRYAVNVIADDGTISEFPTDGFNIEYPHRVETVSSASGMNGIAIGEDLQITGSGIVVCVFTIDMEETEFLLFEDAMLVTVPPGATTVPGIGVLEYTDTLNFTIALFSINDTDDKINIVINKCVAGVISSGTPVEVDNPTGLRSKMFLYTLMDGTFLLYSDDIAMYCIFTDTEITVQSTLHSGVTGLTIAIAQYVTIGSTVMVVLNTTLTSDRSSKEVNMYDVSLGEFSLIDSIYEAKLRDITSMALGKTCVTLMGTQNSGAKHCMIVKSVVSETGFEDFTTLLIEPFGTYLSDLSVVAVREAQTQLLGNKWGVVDVRSDYTGEIVAMTIL